jgi:hypothetical protein
VSGSEHARPVWLTREQRDTLAWLGETGVTVFDRARVREAVAAWDAAPADPAEAIRRTLIGNGYDFDDTLNSDTLAVLRALGEPT